MHDKSILDGIRASVGYGNVATAMDCVFGSDGWHADAVYLGDAGNDFTVSVTVTGARDSPTAYVSVGNTLLPGDIAPQPGQVGICVPTSYEHYPFAPDGGWTAAIEEVVGTADERKHFDWSPSGDDLEDTIAYVLLLRRYLDQPRMN
ncbi:MAG: hypothetical protein LBV00_00865 [Propionibacteriaceae bacterium]|jgi:hypothetical protein|nr:hypothetical protein [Propionibacteriaceae bacterium]